MYSNYCTYILNCIPDIAMYALKMVNMDDRNMYAKDKNNRVYIYSYSAFVVITYIKEEEVIVSSANVQKAITA